MLYSGQVFDNEFEEVFPIFRAFRANDLLHIIFRRESFLGRRDARWEILGWSRYS